MFAVVASNAKAFPVFNGDTQHWSQLTTYSAGAGGTELATGASTTVSWTVAAGTPRYWAISGVPVEAVVAQRRNLGFRREPEAWNR